MNDTQDPRDTVSSYFHDISSSKPLSHEREVALSARIKKGDTDARDELVKANLLFVINVARKYQNGGLPLSDLISAGNWGLMIAAERFDGTRGYKFISYAVWWIRQSILVALAEQPRMVRLPMSRVGLMQKVVNIKERLERGQDHEPDAEAIAKELEMPVQRVRDILLGEMPVRSLDRALEKGECEKSLYDLLPDSHQESTDAEAVQASDQALVARLLSSLEEREQYVIRRYFGLGGNEPMTLEQIGSLLGVSRERVRQIKEKALKKLSHPSCARTLQALADET